MSFPGLLRHVVTVYRRVDTGDTDDYGQPVAELTALDEWPCLIQPRSQTTAAEQPLVLQAGVVVADHTIFGLPRDLREGDQLVPEPPDGRRFEIMAIDDAGGQAHHVEVAARAITGNVLVAPS